MPMHKRILCMLLALLMILSLIPAFALPSQAASNMKTGEECIQILKDMEGFLEFPVWDHSHYSVGYGSTCGKDDYPNGITKEEADALLRQFLASMEAELNRFADRHGILFSQNQFDALMLFTYNCGTGWLYGDGDFRQAVLDNATGNNFIFYMSQWCVASSELHLGLVNRRLIEADMYLNGNYTNVKPASYTYVLFDNNGGDGSSRVQGYDSNLTAYVKAVPTRDGYKFLGWYTEAEGGSWITELSAENGRKTLYAHWQQGDASAENPAAASYRLDAYLLAGVNIYDAPNGTVTGNLDADAQVQIQGEYVDEKGVKWGCLPNNSWVKLGDPRIGAGNETEEVNGVEVTVTGDCVNVRTGPGTKYKAVAAVWEGDKVVLNEIQSVDGVLWGRFRAGWICLQYTDYTGGLTPVEPEESEPEEKDDKVIATGKVISDGLNIRAAAGTHGYLMGCYQRNDRVEILEKTMVGGTPWGRTNRGWICLTYVQLDPVEEPDATEPETTEPEVTEPDVTEPETTEPEAEEPVVQGISATVTSQTMLNIRAGAGTNFARVGSYSPGEKISILEMKTVGNVIWGRTEKGWVCMDYVRLDDSWKDDAGVYGVVSSPAGLNIRSGPGVTNRPVGSYPAGTRIVVLEQTVVAGQKWGRTEKGWVCMDYVRLEGSVTVPDAPQEPETTEPETNEPEVTEPEVTEPQEKPAEETGTVTAYVLNIRSAAGTAGKIVGGYSQGTKVTILEKTVVNGTVWGRTDKGWISLAYVDLNESDTDAASKEGLITATVLCIRKGPGTGNAIVGTYTQGQKVTILETTKVGTTTWGRTDKGWICMDYVK